MSVFWAAVGIVALVPLLITQRRRALELRRSRQDLRSAEDRGRFTQDLMEAIPSPVFYKGTDGRYLGCNGAFADYLGLRRDQIVGRTTHDVAPKDLADRYAAADAALFAQPGTQEYEVKVRWADGALRDVVMHKATFGPPGGAISGLVGVITDITERKRAEQQVLSLKDELELRVLERTRELEASNGALARARDAAEGANRAKTAFLANMSHELRTPLNAILGFAQILEGDPAIPADRRRQIGIINRSGHHLLSLINNVLEISRIEAGRMSLHNAAFDLEAVLLAVEEMTRPRAEAKGLAFSIERAGKLPAAVRGDAPRLRQVLLNLLGNAVKFTDRGGVRLRVRAEGEGRLRFEVVDSGPGIAPDDREKIFFPFYQTEAGLAKGEGTGLGLAISREIVRMMGGELGVTGEPNQGSTFAFAVPLPTAASAPAAGGGARVVGLADGQPAPRILVAEDQRDNQEVIMQLLEDIGCQVRVAENGRLAVEACHAWRPDLILMDVRMPVMDGLAATAAIRASEAGAALPIVALTASAFEEDRSQILAAGCTEMVSKPFNGEHLFAVIGRLLDLRYRYAPAAEAPPVRAAADFAGVPAELREELAQAAAMLDTEAALAVAERMRGPHPAAAASVVQLLGSFDFERIEALCLGVSSQPA